MTIRMRPRAAWSAFALLAIGYVASSGCASGGVDEGGAVGDAAASGAELSNAFCVQGDADELCSQIPHDITEVLPGAGYSALSPDLQRPFDVFAWQMFVALNWPANADGSPAAGPIGSMPGAPRVWEHYESPSEVFGLTPEGELMRAAQRSGRRVFRLLAKSDHGIPNDGFLESTGQPLVDRNLNFVVYDVVMNPVEAAYIRANGLDTKAGQQAFQSAGKAVSFPLGTYADDATRSGGSVGAIEVKSAWRLLDPASGDDPSRYYTVDGTIYVDADQSASGEAFTVDATLGLVGFHAIQRTAGPRGGFGGHLAQDWLWTSFEHVDNAPLAANAREADDLSLPLPSSAEPPSSVAKSYSFYDPRYTGPTNEPPKGPYKWATTAPYAQAYANPGGYGTQVVRGWKLYPSTQALNELWQQKLAGTVWANYFLLSNQWQGGVEDPTTENGNIPRYLSNTTLETYIQFESYGSCIDCHGKATTAAGQDANFSFLLGLAK